MGDITMFEKEKRLIILASRIFDREAQKETIVELVKDKTIKWDVVVKYLCRTKVMGLFWDSIKMLKVDIFIPNNIARILDFFYLGNSERNKILLEEYALLSQLIFEAGIRTAPLKGIALLNMVYTDIGARQLNDIDLLVSYRDKEALNELLINRGFQHGHIGRDENGNIEIKKFDRVEEIIWKTKMNNLAPFYKITGNKWCNILDIDCSFALDYRLIYQDVTNIIDNRLLQKECGYELKIEDFFIQICCHLYKEASNASWIILGNELNIIKFCDVREVFYRYVTDEVWKNIVELSIEYGYNKAVYFCLYYIEVIYDETVKYNFKSDLKIVDEKFLYEFGKREYGEAKVWKSEFMDRLFEGSFDEIDLEKGNFQLIY